jgi:hypothetical protein
MLRRFGAAVAALALLYGFSAAPLTHAHHAIDSVSDERHPSGETIVHTHASPHAHHDADHTDSAAASHEGSSERIWSVESFVFQPPTPNRAPVPVLCVFGEPHVPLTGISLGVPAPQPKAHGPPVESPSGLRAPPAFPPPFV